MTVDIPKLRKYVEWVEEQEALPVSKRKWFQKWWRTTSTSPVDNGYIVLSRYNKAALVNCGTLCCVAGKICEDEGLEFTEDGFTIYQGEEMMIPRAASEILGINPSAASDLWIAGNKARDIRKHAERIAGERL